MLLTLLRSHFKLFSVKHTLIDIIIALPDFLSTLAFNHSCQGSGSEIHQRLHVQGISSACQLTQAPRVQSYKLLIKQLTLLNRQKIVKECSSCAG